LCWEQIAPWAGSGAGKKFPVSFTGRNPHFYFRTKTSGKHWRSLTSGGFETWLAKVLLNKGYEHEVLDDTGSNYGFYSWRR
jgi:hypothetical protein